MVDELTFVESFSEVCGGSVVGLCNGAAVKDSRWEKFYVPLGRLAVQRDAYPYPWCFSEVCKKKGEPDVSMRKYLNRKELGRKV
jgi:hypothetical protein